MDSDLYVVAGTDLRSFVGSWLDEVDSANPDRYPLLALIAEEPEPNRAFFGVAYMLEHITPRLWSDAGSREELLLFAVLQVFGLDGHSPWQGCSRHVDLAFQHLRTIGEIEAARRLRENFFSRANPHETSLGPRRGHDIHIRSEFAQRLARESSVSPVGAWLLRSAAMLDPRDSTSDRTCVMRSSKT